MGLARCHAIASFCRAASVPGATRPGQLPYSFPFTPQGLGC